MIGFIIFGVAASIVSAVLAVNSLSRGLSRLDRISHILMATACVPMIAELVGRAVDVGQLPTHGQFGAIAFYALGVLAVFLVVAIRDRASGIAGLVYPYVAVLFVVAAAGARAPVVSLDRWPLLWLNLHTFSALGAYALFTVASILAVAYLVQDHNLKTKDLGYVFQKLPALETLDYLMRRQIGLAFMMLTAAIICGFVMARASADVVLWLRDPKVVATGVTWVVYAGLVHLRTWADRHGRKVAIATIGALFVVLFTFWGVGLIGDSIHDLITSGPAGN